jgi:SsrA-binding protein
MSKIIALNRKARFNYIIEEEIEAGIMLLGSEIKSIRAGKVNINDAHANEIKGDLYLLNSHINEYAGANRFNHEPRRARKLLLHKKQLNKLIGKIDTKGITLVPLSLYFNARNIVKVKLGVAKGKKLHDKRASIKERDERRSLARSED